MSTRIENSPVRTPIIRVIDCHIARPSPDGGHQFLLLKRSSKKIYANTWRMVGGKLHSDETAWQGCLRELREETQLTVERLLAVPYVNRFYEWKHDRINDIPVFVAVVGANSDPKLDDEHTAHRWVTLPEAMSLLPWPGQREGLRAADALLSSTGPLVGFMELPQDRITP